MGIVRENINFERGLDPKQSMDIGFLHKWINLKKGDLFKIKRDFTTGSDNRLDDTKHYNTFLKGDYLIINDPGQQYEDNNIGFTAFIIYKFRSGGGTDRVKSHDDKFLWGTPLQFEGRLEKVSKIGESQNFERGIDPKDSMKIGRVGERDIKKILDKLVELRGGEYKIEYTKNWGKRTPYFEGTYFMAPVYDKVFRADNFFIRYYPPQGVSADYFTYGYLIDGRMMKEQIITTAEEGLKKILSHLTVYPHDSASESINFERGLDPKKAMKIGKNFLPYKKGDKVKVWVPWEKRLVEVRVYEDEELDSDGKTKIKKMISNSKPSWEVRRIWIRYNGEVRTANLAIHPEAPEQDMWILHQ